MYPDNYLNKENDKGVYFFSSPYDVLNNWGANGVTIWGRSFSTAEHAYQYKKFETTDTDVANLIANAPSPWAVYQIALKYKAKTVSYWNEIKLGIMEEILRQKLEQNEDVRVQLLKTGERKIIENSPWDEFWGVGANGSGQNNLGKIWERLREEIDP